MNPNLRYTQIDIFLFVFSFGLIGLIELQCLGVFHRMRPWARIPKNSILDSAFGDMQISPLLAGLAQTNSFVQELSSTCGAFQPLENLKWISSCKPSKARICTTCTARETYKLIDRRSAFLFSSFWY